MKLSKRFVSILNDPQVKEKAAKKLLTTALATAIMGLVLFAIAHLRVEDPTLVGEATGLESLDASDIADGAAPVGLSRDRKDFDKALGMLASAADENSDLAAYYSRVQKRVKGEAFPRESGSGVRIVKRAQKRSANTDKGDGPHNAVTADAQQGARSVVEKIKGFFGDAMRADAGSEQPAAIAQAKAASASTRSPRLTVGDMVFESNPAIDKWVTYYTTSRVGRQTMSIGIKRSDAYLDLARQEFRRLGVPEDLVWLAFVESVWHPEAVSPAAAGGLWQFIPRTATDYGLTVTPEVDERRDPLKQTRVAATYLRDLYTIFGDWTLAMAAYNCGEPRVMDALVKNGKADFWDLYEKQLLPKETMNYVPKILAAIQVTSQPEAYGFAFAQESAATALGQ